jgi:hypothetical protein
VGVRTIDITLKKKDREGDDDGHRRKRDLVPLWEYILKEYDGVSAPQHFEMVRITLSHTNLRYCQC